MDSFKDQQDNILSSGREFSEESRDDSNIHFAFLFASPLVLKTSENIYHDVLKPISFAEEFEQIKIQMEEKEKEFLYRYQLATPKHLKEALRDNPIGLHFSGHGFMNNEKLFRQDTKSF